MVSFLWSWWGKPKPRKPNKSLEIAIYLTLEGIMADVSNLTAAVAALSDAVAANTAAVEEVKAIVAAAGTPDQATVDGITTSLVQVGDNIKANTEALMALKPAA